MNPKEITPDENIEQTLSGLKKLLYYRKELANRYSNGNPLMKPTIVNLYTECNKQIIKYLGLNTEENG